MHPVVTPENAATAADVPGMVDDKETSIQDIHNMQGHRLMYGKGNSL